MSAMTDRRDLAIQVTPSVSVSGLLLVPPKATCLYVLAHGAGAGMRHPFMAAVAEGLAARQIATLRYQFPYMERGSRRPDPPRLAHATVRAAVAAARDAAPRLPLIAGGKSFGARMTSQVKAEAPLPDVVGLAAFTPSMMQRIDLARLYVRARRAMPETMDDTPPLPVPEVYPVMLGELLADE